MKKIWDRGVAKKTDSKTSQVVEDYTVGIDYLLDLELLPYDIMASMAHAKMLHKIKILNSQELKTLITGLNKILSLSKVGKFKIDKSQEDGHTAIEAYLTEHCGIVGKKVHTGRSRNDQALVTVRLFSKEKLLEIKKQVEDLIKALEGQIKKQGKIKMPGYTHMQRAMPSSVGMLLASYHDSLEDDLILIDAISKIIDQNPLGSAAGYGENILGLDRKFTTKELNFKRVQENPIYCALSRGKFENLVLQAISSVMFDIGKIASDLLLFTTKEFDFFTLPDSFKTGSSIMPQKKNYDVLELIRGNIAIFNGYQHQIENVIKNLFSGYNRDFQLTKEPYIKGMKLALDTIRVMTLVVKNLEAKKKNLESACTPELYATDEALRLVKKGKSFREAYQEVKEKFY
ncbi:MAG: Argininosuccinate lyase [Candidatus Nomurabacteria bacterium GW2011_GWF2_40_31]|uniref:Argininosuccinate lyase n=2 Tax=Candidatus Nomuraibacteriota TaxID=1752729 RepID=A0A837HUN0_9BACT|nr:MAG: Argininosuccinate lyase [Candidatus Nomurabacteria bacterium GW2011_GWD2_39_12]KKR20765.1 MAG: Argininosuccinate lyase [Candidatus Nomurabacteria bacterium GW2011_GWC2_39_41]KKR36873.1 MAG: Argininosuccinate lyase [Candidatus Nomurabacteria bacterium GW2011_GWE2_40_10]KKR38554.1 MAG: Argininosuccinate lyase [Candidatus Nomurabacteria bacterium GW2011_GWB1_40_11]KKR40279.1 MAG: Argininosuccinate lyase [Parcubacteria group bacterium GW2011_GWC1_40_11]KKR59612.1 MAG: Argininosuccinate lya